MPNKLSPEQKVFNVVVRHLRKQGKQSGLLKPGDKHMACFYRAADGSRCAVGALISNKDYRPGMEEKMVDTVFWLFPHIVDSIAKRFGDVPVEFLKSLQLMHDRENFEGWEPRFESFVENNPAYELKIPPLKA